MHSSTKRFPNGPFMIYQYYQEIKDYNFSENQILGKRPLNPTFSNSLIPR